MDLNLLTALDALLNTASVAEAAQRMHLSPPAMSHTLARIRDALGDPILVRAGRRLVPTPRANALRDPVRKLVAEAKGLLQSDAGPSLDTLDKIVPADLDQNVAAYVAVTWLAADYHGYFGDPDQTAAQ